MRFTIEDKRAVLTSGVLFDYNKARREAFLTGNDEKMREMKDDLGEFIISICRSLSSSKSRKKKLIEKRFRRIIECGKAKFVTLTFSNEFLKKTSTETRRKYVQRWCKENGAMYVANIDFSPKKHREHYHALILPWNESIEARWCGGFTKIKSVNTTEEDKTRTAKYVAKLGNHALKEIGELPRLIWSRGWSEARSHFDENYERLPF